MTRSNPTREERAIFDERAKARNIANGKKANAKRAVARKAANAPRPPVGIFSSKTAPSYRRQLPPVPEMLMKSELRAFLTQALVNSGGVAL